MNSSVNLESLVKQAMDLDRQGRMAEAIAVYQHVLASWPGLPNCWYNLALLQRKTGEYSAALASYQEALERHVAEPEAVHLNRGVIFSDYLHQYEAAEREFNTALHLNPSFIPALINLANLHEDLGRRDLAAAAYERILALAPDSPQILARYAALESFSTMDDPLIGRLRQALAQPGISAADRASVEFALGRALDAIHAYDAAFDVYRSANRHSRESAGPGFRDYDLKFEERFTERLIAAFPCAARPAAHPGTVAPDSPPRPIFVCGMFRSGSTLAEQLLAGHPQVRAGGELDFLPRTVQTRLAPFPESVASLSQPMLESLAAEYRGLLRGFFPEAVYVTDKRPDNFLYIGLIKMLFPHAKIVHTSRDALDNCLSIYFLHLDQVKSYALDLMDIGHHYVQYLRLMAHWKTLFGADILDLDYDALVKDPQPAVERTLAFLGLDWDERCLSVPPAGRAVKTASVWQVREPLYRRSSGRARHYERQLGALRDYLDHHR
ncbi:MAG: tetratricopeptide repeat-containing sulfotransferase family protein [Steroidobacteraceae bacterium]